MTTIPFGLCQCGCGGRTLLAKRTHTKWRHYKGQPKPYIRGHHLFLRKGQKHKSVTSSYRMTWDKAKGKSTLHRERAEKALGKSLPAGAVVHHADGSISDNAPLVICQDNGYHKLLHARMRIKAMGGNPNSDLICGSCQQVLSREAFGIQRSSWSGRFNACRACVSARRKKVAA